MGAPHNLVPGGTPIRTVVQVVETDTAQPIRRTHLLGQAFETDTAQAITHSKRRTIGQATEIDTALPLVTAFCGFMGGTASTQGTDSLHGGTAATVGTDVINANVPC